MKMKSTYSARFENLGAGRADVRVVRVHVGDGEALGSRAVKVLMHVNRAVGGVQQALLEAELAGEELHVALGTDIELAIAGGEVVRNEEGLSPGTAVSVVVLDSHTRHAGVSISLLTVSRDRAGTVCVGGGRASTITILSNHGLDALVLNAGYTHVKPLAEGSAGLTVRSDGCAVKLLPVVKDACLVLADAAGGRVDVLVASL
mmetsp:Transcript_22727/g.44595  ORF Transcript_22727/g.44595 Transcript_22727/m.44595 type:complete len:203 (-) Transcript_22727:2993-3601(-)